MDYRGYSAEDFALEEKFQKWVLKPDRDLDAYWSEWLTANPDRSVIIEDAKELVRAAGLSEDAETNKAFLEGWDKLRKNAQPVPATMKGSWKISRIAATLAILAVVSFGIWKIWEAQHTVRYATAYNEVREFWLEDGSRVVLNSNSKLTLTPDWGEKHLRQVTLEGEAFFEVVQTSDSIGFEVKTSNDVSISVLGTKFNVNTRHEEVKVFLQSGKVRVNSSIGEALLAPGDLVSYKQGHTEFVVNRRIGNHNQLLSWKEEMFVFDDTPLREVIRQVEDNYGLQVTVKGDTLLEKRITAKIPRRDVSILLNVLSETLGIQVERNGSKLTIK